jgi:hypothetical protein
MGKGTNILILDFEKILIMEKGDLRGISPEGSQSIEILGEF